MAGEKPAARITDPHVCYDGAELPVWFLVTSKEKTIETRATFLRMFQPCLKKFDETGFSTSFQQLAGDRAIFSAIVRQAGTPYNRSIRWSRPGVFSRIFAALAGKGGRLERIMIGVTQFEGPQEFTMHIFKPLSVTLIVLTLGLTASYGHAASGQSGSLTEIALQRHFALTDNLLARYEAAHADVHANPCNALPAPDMQALQNGQMPSFDELAARYDAQPAMHAILTRHGISAKDYLLTQAVLGAGRLKYEHQMMEKANPQAASNIDASMTVISSANYSFFLAHRSQIQQATLREMHSQSTATASRNLNCLIDKLQGK